MTHAPPRTTAPGEGAARVFTRAPWREEPGGFWQPKRGYRYRAESPMIRELVSREATRILDLGAGAGVIGLSAAVAARAAHITLVERNAELAAFSRANLAHFGRAGEVLEVDLRQLELGRRFDLVVTNPPFFPAGSGRESRHTMVREATHTYHGDLGDFVAAGERHLTDQGSLWVVYPAEALAALLAALHTAALWPSELVLIHARHKTGPFRVWVRAGRQPAALSVAHLSALTDR